MNKPIHIGLCTLASTALILTACFPQGEKFPGKVVSPVQPLPQNRAKIPTPEEQQAALEQLYQEREKQLRELHTPQRPYTGQLSLQVSQQKVLKSERGFRTQVAPNGQVVFQETFVKGEADLDVSRILTVTDPSKRYILYVKNGDGANAHQTTQAEVFLNGQSLLPSGTLDENNTEYTREKLVLQSTQTLQIKTQGENLSELTVMVVQSDQNVGVVLKNFLSTEHEPATTNHPSFDPGRVDQLVNTLPAIPGNRNVRFPETNIAQISMNGHRPEDVAPGEIYLTLKAPVQENLNTLMQEYNAIVLQEVGTNTFLLAPDMTKVNPFTLESDIKALNSRTDDPYLILQNIDFANLESAKTLAFAMRMILDNRVEGIGFNPVMQTQTIDLGGDLPNNPDINGVKTIEAKVPYQAVKETGNLFFRPAGEHYWWLNERSSRVNQAWAYSTGYARQAQRPIKVAVIDEGFLGLDQANETQGDLAGRVRFNDGKVLDLSAEAAHSLGLTRFQPGNDTKPWGPAVFNELQAKYDRVINSPNDADSVAPLVHGTHVASTIGSGINDGVGIAGVAPAVQIIPFQVGSKVDQTIRSNSGSLTSVSSTAIKFSELYRAIELAKQAQADVINISMNLRDTDLYMKSYADFMINNTPNIPNKHSWLAPMQDLIRQVSGSTVIVASAGNFGWPALYSIPGKFYFPEILVVGALQEESPPPLDLLPLSLSRTVRNLDTQIETTETSNVNTPTGDLAYPAIGNQVEHLERNLSISKGDKAKLVTELKVGSNYGDGVDIYAPGSNMLAIGPKVQGTDVWDKWNATSAAAPVVAGTVALMKAIAPSIDVNTVRRTLYLTARNRYYSDDMLRGFPFPDLARPYDDSLLNNPLATKCDTSTIISNGEEKEFYNNCGNFVTGENKNLLLRTLDAKHAVLLTPGFNQNEDTLQKMRGYWTSSRGLFYNVEQSQTYNLDFSMYQGQAHTYGFNRTLSQDPSAFFSTPLRPPFQSGGNEYSQPYCFNVGFSQCQDRVGEWFDKAYPTHDYIFQNYGGSAQIHQGNIEVQGWQNGHTLYVLNLSVVEDEEDFDPSAEPSDSPDPSDSPEPSGSSDPSPEPTPEPTPVATLPPQKSFSAPVVVSQLAGGSNIARASDENKPSPLKDGPFGSYAQGINSQYLFAGPAPAASWVKPQNIAQPIQLNYPRVPNTHDLDRSSEKFKLRILVQVRNKGKGGSVTIGVGGDVSTERFGPGSRHPDAELKPIVFNFFDAASESGSSRQVSLQVANADPDVQLIYKVFAVPND